MESTGAALASIKDELVQAVCASVEQRVEAYLAGAVKASRSSSAAAAAEESRPLSDDCLSEEERAAQDQLRAETAGLRERVGHLERSLAEAKEAAAWAAGQDAARREAVEAYMARLDEERFERKRLQEQLNASSEELLTLQRNLHLTSVKLEKAQKGKGKDNPKSNGVAKPSAAAAANPGITEVLDRLELTSHLLAESASRGGKPLDPAEAGRLQSDLSHCTTVGAVVPVVELLKSDIVGAQEPAARALVAHCRWAGARGCAGASRLALEAGVVTALVKMLGEAGAPAAEAGAGAKAPHAPSPSAKFAAAEALASLAASGSGAERSAVCEAMAAEGAVARLVELLGYDDHSCRRAVVTLMLQLCDTASKHCSALALAGGIDALLPLIALPHARQHPALSGDACRVISHLACTNASSRVALVEAGGIAPLAALLTEGPSALHFAAAQVMAPVADSPETRSGLLEAGVVGPLVGLLLGGDAEGCRASSLVLCKLSAGITECLPGAEPMLQPGFRAAVIETLRRCSNHPARRSCAVILHRLGASSESLRAGIVAEGGAEALSRLLLVNAPRAVWEQSHLIDTTVDGPSWSMAAAAATAGALGALIEGGGADVLRGTDAKEVLKCMTHMLQEHPQLPTAEEVAVAIGQAARVFPDLLLDCGAVQAMVRLLRAGTPKSQKTASVVLAQLHTSLTAPESGSASAGRPSRCLLLEEGVISALVATMGQPRAPKQSTDGAAGAPSASGSPSSAHAAVSTLCNMVCNHETADAVAATGGILALAGFLSDGEGHPGLAAAAARALWRTLSLVSTPEAAVPAVPLLVEEVARDSNAELQVLALRALQGAARFELCTEAAVGCGAVPSLLSLLGPGPEPLRQAAADVLAAMAESTDPAVADLIVQGGAIPLLVDLLADAELSMATRSAASEALANLAYMSEDHSIAIVKSGALPPLMDLLEQEGEVCVIAAHAIQHLIEPSTRDAVIAAGALPRLIPLLSHSDAPDLQLAATITLNSLASTEEGVEAILSGGGTQLLIDLLEVDGSKPGSWTIAKSAAWVLTKLSYKLPQKEAIVAAGGLDAALRLVDGAAEFLGRKEGSGGEPEEAEEAGQEAEAEHVPEEAKEATWCAAVLMLRSLAQGWPEVQDRLLGTGAAQKLLVLLRWGGPPLQETVAGVVLELVQEDSYVEPLELERRKQALLELGVLEPLVRVLTSRRHGAAAKERPQEEEGAQVEAGGAVFDEGEAVGAEKEMAARALAYLVDSQASRTLIAEEGGLAALVGMLEGGQEEDAEAAAAALEALAKDELVEPILQAGAIPPLVGMLPPKGMSAVTPAMHDAATTLMHLSGKAACRAAMHSAGCVPALLGALWTPCGMQAGLTLQHLCSDEVVGPRICSVQMVEQFKDRMSSSGDADEMRTVCAMAILNLTEDHRNHAALLRGGIVPELLRLLQEVSDEEAVETAAVAIFRLGASEEGCREIAGAGGALSLCQVLATQNNPALQLSAAQALCNLVPDSDACALMTANSICEALLRVMVALDTDTEEEKPQDGILMHMGGSVLRLIAAEQRLPGSDTATHWAEEVRLLMQLLVAKASALQQVAAGCICELQEQLLPVVKEQGLLPELARALTAAAGEQKSHSLGLDDEQGRSTWFPFNDTFVVDIHLALKVLQGLAMDEDPECGKAVCAGGGVGALLDVLCTLHGDPLSALAGRSSGVLEALSHLAKQAEGHRLMSGPQAVYAVSAFMAPLLEELELVGNSAVGSAAAGRLKAAEHLLELAGLLLWQLSAEEEAFAVEFSSQGGFIQLDHMLRTDRPSLKSLALKLLNVLVSTPHPAVKEAWVTVPFLVNAVRSETAALQRDAINVLRLLSKDQAGCSEVTSWDAIPALVELLQTSDDAGTQRASVKALRTIGSWQAQNVAAAGAIPLLVGLIDHPKPELRKEGMIALLSIVMLDAARLAMHDAGVVPVLVRLLEDPDAETREWAAKVLNALGMHEDSKALITKEGAQDVLIRLLKVKADSKSITGDVVAAATALQTMLYECPETSLHMLESGAHHSLLNLLRQARKTNNVDAMAASGTALLNFAQESEEVRSDLAESAGALQLLVGNLQEMDCSNGGTEAGTGGAEQPAGAAEQVQAYQEAAASLIGILAEEDDSYATSIGQTQAISSFVDLLRSSNMGSKRASAWALRHLAAIDENRMLMVEQGAIEALLKLIEEDFSGDEQGDEAQTAAIGALQILAVNDECSKQIAALGGVASLVRCLQRGSDFCKVVAAGALGTLAYNADNRALIVNSGGIPELVELLLGSGQESADQQQDGHHAEGQESAAVALYSLAVNEENRQRIAEAGAVPPLLIMIESELPEAQEAAAQALGALAKSQVCRSRIGEQPGAVAALVALLTSEEQSVREEVARALHNLALEPGSQKGTLVASGAVEGLLAMLKQEESMGDGADDDARRVACQALAVLASQSGAADAMMRVEAGIWSLLRLLEAPGLRGLKVFVAQTLAGCAGDPRVAAEMQAGGAAASLLAILAAGSDAAQLWAIRGLRCMAEAGAGHEGAAALLDAGAASALMKLMEEAPEAPSSSDALLEALLDLLGLLCRAGVEGKQAQVLGPDGLLTVAGVFGSTGEGPCAAAAKVLASLADDDSAFFMAADVLPDLVKWITATGAASFHSGGEEPSSALCRLAALPEHAVAVLSAGGAAALVGILGNCNGNLDDPDMDELQVAAARAVAALAGLEGCSAAIVDCGGAEVLVALLNTPEGRRRPTVALTLTALDALICSGESDSTSGLVVVAGAVDPLRRLLEEGDEREAELAAVILEHLQASGNTDRASDYSKEEDLSDYEPSSANSTIMRMRSFADSPGVVEEPREDSND